MSLLFVIIFIGLLTSGMMMVGNKMAITRRIDGEN